MTLIANTVSALRGVLPGDVEVTADAEDVRVEGTGQTVVQVLHGGPWGVATYNRGQHEVVHLNIYADATRNDFNERVKDDADQKAYAAYLVVDRLLHDVNHELRFVVQSWRRFGPALTLIPNGDGAVLCSAEWEVIQ